MLKLLAIPSAPSAYRGFSFGTFRLVPGQQLLLEEGAPVRLGARALDILTALVERAGKVVGKNELMTRAWPNSTVEEINLRVNVAALRKALGDGQPGRRYVANVPGQGYCFVGSVETWESVENPEPTGIPVRGTHNLPPSIIRPIGRADTIDALAGLLSEHRFVTIVGPGGIGKTTLALAVADKLLATYPDGIKFIDLSPVRD